VAGKSPHYYIAIRVAGIAVLALLATGCAFFPGYLRETVLSPPQEAPSWSPLFRGVSRYTYRQLHPPLHLVAVRIDTTAAGITFVVTPPNGTRPLDTDGEKTSTFLSRNSLQVACNATPYAPDSGQSGAPRDIVGLGASQGIVYSPLKMEFGALVIKPDNRVLISPNPAPPFVAGVGGYGLLFNGPQIYAEQSERHPRTAAGTANNGRTLILLVADGRQPAFSVGLTRYELALWLSYLGAERGLNLDGGGSSALVVEGRDGEPLELNRPVHNMAAGEQAIVGNNIGVRAARLDSLKGEP